jgi:hypothetical protein
MEIIIISHAPTLKFDYRHLSNGHDNGERHGTKLGNGIENEKLSHCRADG